MAHWDPQGAFEVLKKRISSTVKDQFPIEGKKHELVATRVWVDDNKHIDDIRGQTDSKLRERTWSVPVRAELELRDKKTSKVLDRQAYTLAQLPKITNRYTYIVGGNEWQVNNMFRLKSGVYTHIKENGELASQWNLAKGLNFNMDFKPKTKEMTLQFSGKGANIPLYPLLKTMGVDDDTIERAWGKEVLSANKKHKIDVALRKFYKTFKGENPETLDQARQLVEEEFGKTVMRPEATKLTLGKPFDQVTGKALLAGSDRILKVARGESEQDDRDSLQFKDLFSAEDLITERAIEKHNWSIKRKLGNNVDKQTKIKQIVNPDIFGKPIKNFFTSSNLTERPDQMNPMSYISGNRRTTIRGEGGITKAHQVTMGAKAINPSHIGFLDVIQTPESPKIGTTLQLAASVRKKGNEIEIPVIDVKTGKMEWIDPGTALKSNLAYPDQYKKVDGKFKPVSKLVKITDEHGQTTIVKSGDVDYVLNSTKGMFDLSANLIPYLQNNQGNRTMVAAKQIEQAVSLTGREAPLVQIKAEGKNTFENIVGGFSAHDSPVNGQVLQVKPDGIIIRDDKGKRHEIQLYNNFPLNDDKSVLSSHPLVKKGDTVKKGQTISDTNFTKDGVLALGTSLNVAYMPYKGYNFEDGIVISESAAKKLTSDHMFRSNIRKEKNIILDKKKLRAEIGAVIPKSQINKLDDDAVIKEGEIVEPGDILIGALKHEEFTPEKQKMALFGKGRIKPVRPQLSTWDKDVQGKVARVTKHGKCTTVYVTAQTPADIGDKIVGRHGNKGITTLVLPDHEMPHTKEGQHAEVLLNPTGVPCYDSDTEFLTTDGWVAASNICKNHVLATLNQETLTIEFQEPEEVYHIPHQGKMYRLENQQLDILVTSNHKQFTARRGNYKLSGVLNLDDPEVSGLFELKEAKEIIGDPRRYLKAAKWQGESEFLYYIPPGTQSKTGPKLTHGINVSAPVWAEFMGWFLSEGSTYFNKANYGYVVEISQSRDVNPDNYEQIVKVMESFGLTLEKTDDGVRVKHKGLYERLHPLGGAKQKYIPVEILIMEPQHLQIFLNALVAGDGNEVWNEETGHYGCRRYWTSSKKLADGVQEVAAKLSIAANIKRENRRDKEACYYISLSGSKIAPWVNWSSTTKANQIEEWVDYDGVVHCATVPNGTLFVRRNGKAVFSGNSRINVGQILETAASKIARKTGKPYIVDNFNPDNTDYTRNLKEELNKLGLSDTEEMFDPTTKRSFGKVLTGDQYIYKLHHTAAKGLSARSRDAYDSNMTPRKGGPHGAQTMDAMGLYAMLAHNARENVREMQSFKSDFNDDFWAALQAGESIPTPKTPFVFKKFEGYLKSMGIDIDKQGNDLILTPLTDKKVLAMSNGELKNAGATLVGRNLKPEPEGIFDPKKTGTIGIGGLGDKWTHITLAERMPNPVFEAPVKSLLGLSTNDYQGLLNSQKELNGKTGPQAIVEGLDGLNLKKEKVSLESELPNLRTTKLNKANKKLKYIRALERASMGAKEAYTMKHLPVMPPTMRPVSILDSGNLNLDDVNKLYTMIANSNDKLRDHDPKVMPEEEAFPLRTELYDGLKALTLTGAINKGRHLNAIATTIVGKGQPKEGFFQDKIIGRRQDLSMRGTIVPEPSMSLDEVGIPRSAAKEIYKPFIVRRMVQMGMTPLQAQRQLKENAPVAQKALDHVINERPLLLKRDPVLHKFGVQAFRPKLVEGKAIKIHPLVTSGYNADFDGDKMSIIGDIITIVTKDNVCYDEDMKHIGKIIAHRIIDISQFPRVENSAVRSKSGSTEYDVPEGVFVPSYRDGKFHTLPVTKFHIHPNCEEWFVKTKEGRELHCSSDHSLTLLDPDTLEVVKACPSEAIGRCMPILRSLDNEDLLKELPGDNSRGYRTMESRVPLTGEVGWFIGTTVGDGWVRGQIRDAVVFAHGEDGNEVQQEWLSVALHLSRGANAEERIMPHEFNGYDCESVKTTVCSTALACWLDPLIGRKAEFKHLPEHFMEMPEKCRQGLFCGLIDTDGTVNWNEQGQFTLAYNTSSRRLAEEMILLSLSLGLHGKITTTKSPTSGKPHYVIPFSIRPVQDACWIKLVHPEKVSALERLQQKDPVEFGRNDFVPLPDQVREELLKCLKNMGASKSASNRNKEAFSQYVVLNRGSPTITRESVSRLEELLEGIEASEYLYRWFTIATDTSIGWDLVTSSKPTGNCIEMYDLTVPDAWTFTMADGAAVWDSAFVPVGNEAVKEAFKMFPSNNLFSPSNGNLMFKPGHESMLGLYKLTEMKKGTPKNFKDVAEAARAVKEGKIDFNDPISLDKLDASILEKLGAGKQTTVGRLMIYSALPKELRDPKILNDPMFKLDKNNLQELLTQVGRKKKGDFARTADKLKDMGNEYSTGLSIGLEDFYSDKESRDPILKMMGAQEAKIRSTTTKPEKKEERLVRLYSKAGEIISNKAKIRADASKNRMYDWVRSGARGNWDQFKQMTVAPMLVVDARGRTVPIPITKSYSEGLDIGSYLASMHGARMGTISRVEGTWRPGLASKQIMQTTMDQMIVDEDCGTTKGLRFSINDRDLIGRYTVGDIKLGTKGGRDKGSIPSGTLVTPDILNRFKNNKITDVRARSPLKCSHGVGMCSKCYGVDERGELPPQGTNVGIIAAQALGEPATQLAMNAFHMGGVVGARGTTAVSTFDRLDQLLGMPKRLPGAAVLSNTDGEVDKVQKDPAGGWSVFVKGQRHYVPGNRELLIRRGSKLKKGDAITSGPKNPRDMLKLTGKNSVQSYLVDEIQKVYKNEAPLSRRNTETFVRSLTNLSEVKNSGDNKQYLRGDHIPTSKIEEFNSRLKLGKKPIIYEPILSGVDMLPLELQHDWIARLQSRNLRNTILDAASEGWRSMVHSTHPIPGMAYGKSFGHSIEKPWLY